MEAKEDLFGSSFPELFSSISLAPYEMVFTFFGVKIERITLEPTKYLEITRIISFFQPERILNMRVISIARVRIPLILS